MTFTPSNGLTLTVDYYKIVIDDRIVISDNIKPGSGSAVFDAALAKNGVTGAQFFINGANTKTEGVDVVAIYDTSVGEGDLKLSLAFNTTTTDVTEQFSPGGLNGIKPQDVFGAQGVSIIEEWQPKDRINFTTNYSINDFSVNFSLNRFGEYTVMDGGKTQTFSAEWLTDVQGTWHINDNVSVNIGANNLFDTVPDTNTIGQSRSGTIMDSNGNLIVQSDGVFQYSRRSAPFGFNGAYYYAGITYQF